MPPRCPPPCPWAVPGPDRLTDGTCVLGFLCDPHSADTGTDVTHDGCWRAYLETIAPTSSARRY
ncbi:hypothetical protein [Streptomyces sp. SA15]|uniref:allophanate hydrolase-related protein n=1 Tax=Streptomyces sp. SA15 TaxID=934019 RepID=UPI00359C28A1